MDTLPLAIPDISNLNLSSTEERALKLLGDGNGPEVVANALGVSVGRISQLLSDERFIGLVAERRCATLSAFSERDGKYDSLEDQLLEKLKDLLPLMIRPMEVVRALTLINNAKRRGAAGNEVLPQQTIVNINMPISLKQKFVTNIDNAVIEAGSQPLLTIDPNQLLKKVNPNIVASSIGKKDSRGITYDGISQSQEGRKKQQGAGN